MKTLTLRNIPDDVKEIIKEAQWYQEPTTQAIYKLIRSIPRLKEEIANYRALNDDSKK